jgi:catechol 2,3-dioxygenase-like lactoylglutathione lyase family enzyme
MITKLTHVSIYVLDQASAFDFYTKKLGFKVITDVPMGNGHRWLTELRRICFATILLVRNLRSARLHPRPAGF